VKYVLLHGDCIERLKQIPDASIDSIVTDPPYELGFMGKKWDATGIAYSVALWTEALRVLKPGGHLLAFGGTRTYHRMTCAIEDAGFEVRDCLQWIYGTGFPKSLDVSKAIDAVAGAVREVIGVRDSYRPIANATRDPAGFQDRSNGAVTAPATDAARAWAGWGTALKPACEPIVLARKPLVGTVAANVLAHGTGALNIDGCRIATADDLNGGAYAKAKAKVGGVYGKLDYTCGEFKQPAGRWPANVLLDEAAARLLDEQSGDRQSGVRTGMGYHGANGDGGPAIVGSTGGASRFFYVAKASRKERDLGCEHLPSKSAGEATDREDGSDGLNSPRAGAGRTGGARNGHPTVKPVQLMRYLVRMVTPRGGVVLDPFTGSGTTGIAAIQEGFHFVGVEREDEYIAIARARIDKSHTDAQRFNVQSPIAIASSTSA
jgi:DNA modification methylase